MRRRFQFAPHTANRPERESIVPMINVAFLMLIFFLMVAVIAPSDPLDVVVPSAPFDGTSEADAILSVDGSGQIAFGALRGDAALAAVVGQPVTLRADAALPGNTLARLLTQLAAQGTETIELVTTR